MLLTKAGACAQSPYDAFDLGNQVADDSAKLFVNRIPLAKSLGLGDNGLAWMKQVHGKRATIVDGSEPNAAEATDALVTTTPGVALVVLTADCVPILLSDPEVGVVSAVHA